MTVLISLEMSKVILRWVAQMLESLTNLSAVGQSYRVTALSLVPNGTFTSELMKLKSVTAKRGEIRSYYS